MSKSWFRIDNKAGKKAKVYIYDEIGMWGITARSFMDALADVKGDWDLHIATPGGSIFDGIPIYNAIKNHPGKVSGFVDGVCASMGSYIMLACDTLEIASNGWVMIHNAQGGAWGEATELRKQADVMDGLQETIVKGYMAKTGLPHDELTELMDAETWMDAEEALSKGFVDTIGDSVEDVAACIDPKKFRNAPAMLVGTADTPKRKDQQKKEEGNSMPIIDKNTLVNCGIARSTASDEDAVAQLNEFVANAKADKAALKAANENVEAVEKERDAFKAKFEKAQDETIQAKAQAAVDTKKITEKQKDTYAALLKADPENAEKFLADMKPPEKRKAPTNGADPIDGQKPAGDDDDKPKTLTERVKAKKAAPAAA